MTPFLSRDEPDPASYGDAVADFYDAWYRERLPTSAAVDLLEDLAGEGPVLELGVGTGRLALELARKGHVVHGIDISRSMLNHLEQKQAKSPVGASRVSTVLGDITDFDLKARFQLIYCVFNTFLQLASAETQERCLEACTRHLLPGGAVVLEVELPDFARWTDSQACHTWEVRDDFLVVEFSLHHPVDQRITSQYMVVTNGHVRLCPEVLRYVSKTELELMADRLGLTMSEAFSSWDKARLLPSSRWLVAILTSR